MLQPHEKIIHSCLNGGFLSAEIAWHQMVFNKVGVLPWETMMQIAGAFWLVAVATLLWAKRSVILQQDVPIIPPWYFFLLSVPMCIYASITPWFLLTALSAIRSPVMF
jgi:hypothetical protein